MNEKSDFIVLPSGEWIRKSSIDTWVDRRSGGIEVYFNGSHLIFNEDNEREVLIAELKAMAK